VLVRKYIKKAQWLVFMLLMGVVWYVLYSPSTQISLQSALRWEDLNYEFLFIALLLSPVNWFLESLKWRSVMIEFLPITKRLAVFNVLVGTTMALITPARIGEYAGRLYFLNKGLEQHSVFATLVCSISQMIVTLLFGLIGLILIVCDRVEGFRIDWLYYFVPLLLALLIASLSRLSSIVEWALSSKVIRKLGYTGTLSFDSVDVSYLKVCLLAGIRFAVYSFQYVLVLKFLGVGIGVSVLLSNIIVIYLLQTLLPLPPIASLAGRYGIAALVFSSVGLGLGIVLLASSFIWIINLVLPALVGLGIIFVTKGVEGNENQAS